MPQPPYNGAAFTLVATTPGPVLSLAHNGTPLGTESTLDFGVLTSGQPHSELLQVRNEGQGTLHYSFGSPQPGFSGPWLASGSVTPGAGVFATVGCDANAADAPGVMGDLVLTSDDADQPTATVHLLCSIVIDPIFANGFDAAPM